MDELKKRQCEARVVSKVGQPPSACSCERCVNMCKTPCMPTPYEVEALIDAGYQNRIALSIWAFGMLAGFIDRPIPTLMPAQVNGWCTFFHDGKCELHDTGLKPLEGRLAHHAHLDSREKCVAWEIAKEWISDDNFDCIASIFKKIMDYDMKGQFNPVIPDNAEEIKNHNYENIRRT